MRFAARRPWVIVCALLAACSADLAVPPGTVINCDNGKCPKGYFCQASSQVCISDSGRKGNAPPIISAFAIDDDPVRGISVLRFTVSDSGAELVRIARLELSVGADFTSPTEVPLVTGPGTSFPSGALAELVSSRAGEEHSVTWDSRITAPFSTSSAHLRLTVADVFDAESQPVMIGPFAIVNQSPPRAELLFVKNDGEASAGVVPIAYRLVDDEGDIADVHIDFSTDGVTWQSCTEYPTVRSEGRHDLATAAAHDGGVAHAFYWDSVADLRPYGDARLRIVAADTGRGEEVVLESAIKAGFPGDPRHALTLLVPGNDGNTCEWQFADLNGDGIADPIGACAYPGIFATITTVNASNISFPFHSPFHGDKGPYAIADLDDDGDLDIAFSTYMFGTHVVGFSYNDGAGEFSEPETAPLGGDLARIAAGDFDGDGLGEAIVLDGGAARLARTRPGVGFTVTPASIVGEPVGAVRVHDDHDLLVVRDGGLKLLAADPGAATFSVLESFGALPCVGLPIGVDLDASGALDLVCPTADGVVMWRDPSAGVTPPVKLVGGRYIALAAGKLNDDALPDLVALTINRRAVVPLVARRVGEAAHDLAAGAPLYLGAADIELTGVVLTDLTADGVDEMLVGAPERLGVYGLGAPPTLGDLPGPARALGDLAGTPNAIAAADVDRDGVIDLVIAHGDPRETSELGGLELLPIATVAGVPMARPGERAMIATPRGLTGLAMGDFDGDGLVDAASMASDRNTLFVFFGAQTASGVGFGEPVPLSVEGEGGDARELLETPLAACNLDADPRLELLMVTLHGDAGGSSSGTVRIVDVDTNRALTQRVAHVESSEIGNVTCADFNGDGRRDFAFTGRLNLGAIYLQNAGGFAFGGGLTHAGVMLLTDLGDRDGVPDLVLAGSNSTYDDLHLCTSNINASGLGVGTCTLAAITAYPGPPDNATNAVHGIATTDLDDDDVSDLVYTKQTDPSLIVRTGRVLGEPPIVIGDAVGLSTVLVTDLDADDVADLVTQQRTRQALLIQPMRRPATKWVHAATTELAATRLVTPVPATTDRFGASLFESLALRRYFAPRDGGMRPGLGAQEVMDDLGAAVRNSGMVDLARGLEPLTNAWRSLGGRHFARVPDPLSGVGQRLRITDRFADQRRIVRLPILKGKAPGNVVVFFEPEDWLRASDQLLGADGPWPEGEAYLPRDSVTGREIVLPKHAMLQVQPDDDGNLTNDTSPRYRVDVAGGVVEVLIGGAGSLQAFNVR